MLSSALFLLLTVHHVSVLTGLTGTHWSVLLESYVGLPRQPCVGWFWTWAQALVVSGSNT